MLSTVVIVGASLAGGVAADTLRQEGFDGSLVLVGAEPHPPYERPPLSKSYLRGETPFEKALVRPAGFYEQNKIETLFGVRATRVDPGQRTVDLDSGRQLRYDKLLVATGARNRRLPIPGVDVPGVFGLRSLADADAIGREIAPGRRAVVIGMGFIGCEVAASLRSRGVEVVALDPASAPLLHVLGPEIGQVVGGLHQENGVEAHFGESVTSLEGTGRLEAVVTNSGRRVPCDFAVIGVGVQPEIDFLAGSGVETQNGVLVDEYCRTNIVDVFAAGDVANHYHPLRGRRMRVEHWQNAMLQGAAAARNMLGKERPYDAIHWFWSDQYDVNLQYAGFHDRWDRIIVRGNLARRDFLAFYLNEGRLDAIVAFNRGKELRRAMPLIKSGKSLDVDRLADESVDLRSLA